MYRSLTRSLNTAVHNAALCSTFTYTAVTKLTTTSSRTPSILTRAFSGCGSPACCQNISSGNNANDSSCSTSTNSTSRPKCDPYEQGGKPLDTLKVTQLLSTLEDGWSYSEQKKCISKTFELDGNKQQEHAECIIVCISVTCYVCYGNSICNS